MVFQRMSYSILVIRESNGVGSSFDLKWSIFHGNAKSRKGQHVDIIVVVTNSQTIALFQLVLF
ncbi:hypothetical protein KAI36_01574 [Paenibacillus sp. S02]|nr:hypothetical protein KAI36_01574 [Paenibacillus sp. S02]